MHRWTNNKCLNQIIQWWTHPITLPGKLIWADSPPLSNRLASQTLNLVEWSGCLQSGASRFSSVSKSNFRGSSWVVPSRASWSQVVPGVPGRPSSYPVVLVRPTSTQIYIYIYLYVFIYLHIYTYIYIFRYIVVYKLMPTAAALWTSNSDPLACAVRRAESP